MYICPQTNITVTKHLIHRFRLRIANIDARDISKNVLMSMTSRFKMEYDLASKKHGTRHFVKGHYKGKPYYLVVSEDRQTIYTVFNEEAFITKQKEHNAIMESV